LPSKYEWEVLTVIVGGEQCKYLKAENGWKESGGTDIIGYIIGFSVLPGGFGCYPNSDFSSVGYNGYWWSATENDSYAYSWKVGDGCNITNGPKGFLHSVRCLQN